MTFSPGKTSSFSKPNGSRAWAFIEVLRDEAKLESNHRLPTEDNHVVDITIFFGKLLNH